MKSNRCKNEDDYKDCYMEKITKEVDETDLVCILKDKPAAKEIKHVYIKVRVCSNKIIDTSTGEKIIIEGVKHIKMVYTARGCSEGTETAYFQVPFCLSIPLKGKCEKVIDIDSTVEYSNVTKISSRRFYVFAVLCFTVTYIKKRRRDDDDDNDYCHNDNDNDYCEDKDSLWDEDLENKDYVNKEELADPDDFTYEEDFDNDNNFKVCTDCDFKETCDIFKENYR